MGKRERERMDHVVRAFFGFFFVSSGVNGISCWPGSHDLRILDTAYDVIDRLDCYVIGIVCVLCRYNDLLQKGGNNGKKGGHGGHACRGISTTLEPRESRRSLACACCKAYKWVEGIQECV